MATINYVVFKHHKKQDNTFNVKFRITHKSKQVYFSSVYFVSPSQLKKDFTIKDYQVLDAINADLAAMRRRIEKIGFNIENLSAADIVKEITRPDDQDIKINFITFINDYIQSLLISGKTGSYRRFRQTVNHISDFVSTGVLDARNISSGLLREFEVFLRNPRIMKRRGQRGTTKNINFDGLQNKGVHAVMSNFNTLFNMCRDQYNSEYQTLIDNRPFEYYKMPKLGVSRKKGDDLSIDDIIKFRDSALTGRPSLARDIFFLSFYLCGMNAIDIYKQDWRVKEGRIEYERSKTKDVRKDNAFISIKIPEEAKDLLEKYDKEYIQKRYSSHDSFLWAINKGLGEGLTFYHARHLFATLARNKCRFPKDDVSKALNHVDNTTVTDRYITTDWSIIDRVQEGVLALLPHNNKIQI